MVIGDDIRLVFDLMHISSKDKSNQKQPSVYWAVPGTIYDCSWCFVKCLFLSVCANGLTAQFD